MALCVVPDGSTLAIVGEYTADCAGYALMTAQEYAATPTLAALFAVPDSATVQSAWMAGFSLPVILWLVAWGFGVVINMFRSNETLED